MEGLSFADRKDQLGFADSDVDNFDPYAEKDFIAYIEGEEIEYSMEDGYETFVITDEVHNDLNASLDQQSSFFSDMVTKVCALTNELGSEDSARAAHKFELLVGNLMTCLHFDEYPVEGWTYIKYNPLKRKMAAEVLLRP